MKQKCPCGGKRPKRREPAHRAALKDPYEMWVERFGEVCGICGRGPSSRRRLDRDHCHKSGLARGILCHACNRALTATVTREWMVAAISYLDRFAESQEEAA